MTSNVPNIRKAAILIRSLDAESSARLLAHLSPDEVQSVRSAARSLGPVDPQELGTLLAEVRRAVSTPAAETLAVEQLRPQHVPRSEVPAAAGSLRFDDLAAFDRSTLTALLREVDANVMVLALADSDDELVERIARQMPRQVASVFLRQLRRLGPTRLRDVEAAQQAVVAVAARVLEARNRSVAQRVASSAACSG